jgi:hypothetical protein
MDIEIPPQVGVDARKILIASAGVAAVAYIQDTGRQGKRLWEGSTKDIIDSALQGLTAGLVLFALGQTMPRARTAAEYGLGAVAGAGLI